MVQDEPVVRKQLPTMEEAVNTARGDGWDEACQALAWAMENGSIEEAPAYVAANNPYRT